MEAFKNLNKVSEQYEKEIEKMLPTGEEPLKFKLIGGEPNPDPVTAKYKPVLWPNSVKIPPRDTIKDPYTKKPVDIGVVAGIDPSNNAHSFRGKRVDAKLQGGIIYLYASNNEDMEWAKLMLMSNKNLSNPNRDASVEPMYEMVDDKAHAKRRMQIMNTEMKATQLLTEMEDKQRRNMAISYGLPEKEDPSILTMQLFDKAKADPQGFIDTFNNKNLEKIAVIGRAFDKKIITHIADQNKVIWTKGGEAFVQLSRPDGESINQALAEWVTIDPKGLEVYKTIEGLLNGKPLKALAKEDENSKS